MSTAPVPVVPEATAPAKPLNAIQILEQDLMTYLRQKEQMIANVHAVDGAIQATQKVLGTLRAEAAKAEAEAKKLVGEAEAEIGKVVEEIKEKV